MSIDEESIRCQNYSSATTVIFPGTIPVPNISILPFASRTLAGLVEGLSASQHLNIINFA